MQIRRRKYQSVYQTSGGHLAALDVDTFRKECALLLDQMSHAIGVVQVSHLQLDTAHASLYQLLVERFGLHLPLA